MAISERTVQNKRNSAGELTGKPGTVYDVNIKYKSNGEPKTHVKKGFPTKREAQQYEAAMKTKLANPTYVPPTAAQRKKLCGNICWNGWSDMVLQIYVPVPKPAITAT